MIQYAGITKVAASEHVESTEKREYFDGIYTSPSPDSYGRIVSTDSLPQIAKDASDGRRVLDSHKHETHGIGQTVRGTVVDDQVHGTAYILKGLHLDNQTYKTTDDWAAVIKDGMANSLSIGFLSEREICNLCGHNIWRYPCRHYPLEWETITDPETGEEKRVQCTYTCFGCRLVEVSFVYHGANPDARLVAKAKALVAADVLKPKQIARIENRLNVAILENNRSFFDMKLDKETQQAIGDIVSGVIKPIEAKIAALQKQPEPETAAAPTVTAAPAPAGDEMLNVVDAHGRVVRTLKATELPKPPEPLTEAAVAEAVQTAVANVGVVDAVHSLGERLEKIETAVKGGDGIDDRETAVAENLKQFQRVYGSDADVEGHKASLSAYPDVAAIQTVTQALKQTADQLFSAGRKTTGLGAELETEHSTASTPETANPM